MLAVLRLARAMIATRKARGLVRVRGALTELALIDPPELAMTELAMTELATTELVMTEFDMHERAHWLRHERREARATSRRRVPQQRFRRSHGERFASWWRVWVAREWRRALPSRFDAAAVP